MYKALIQIPDGVKQFTNKAPIMSAPYSRARDHFCHAYLLHVVRVKCIRIERGRKRNCHKICNETTSIGNEICNCLRQLEPHTGLILNQTNFTNIYHINVSRIFEEHTIKIVHKPLTETGTIRIKPGQRDNIVKTGTVPGKPGQSRVKRDGWNVWQYLY